MNFRATLERWKEEVKVSGDKTALTDNDIRGLEMLIEKVEEDEQRLKEGIELTQKYIDRAGYE